MAHFLISSFGKTQRGMIMETYIRLTEDYIFNKNPLIGYPLRLAKGSYVHMKDNTMLACWNENNVPKMVKGLATDMTLYEYMHSVR